MSSIPPWSSSSNTHRQTTPAFTPVQARRSLAQQTKPSPSPSSQPPPPAPPQKKIEWPPSVRQYVQRSFVPEHQLADITRPELETKLKQLITEAAEAGALHTVDWERLPLPQELVREEKRTGRKYELLGARAGETGTGARKRSSGEGEREPPWRKANAETQQAKTSTEKRRRFEGATGRVVRDSSKLQTLELRRKRFEGAGSSSPYSSSATPGTSTPPPPSSRQTRHFDIDAGPVVGRCQSLEKNYFRLTSAPNPDAVRPLPVLEQTLELLKKKWRTENNYTYVCDQFKSLRQDLTVQHIRTPFTTSVYEIHARIALEKGDLGEYNQCQTQLKALYRRGLGGHPMEFLAYRILYFIYTRNWTAINDALAEVAGESERGSESGSDGGAKRHPAVRHALEVRAALARGDYHRFFALYLDTPNMGAYLMDMFVDRERLTALATICRAYKPDVPIRFITEELGFESDEQSARFVLEYGGETLLQEKEDGGVRLLTGKAGLTFEQARAEAHRVVDIKGQI